MISVFVAEDLSIGGGEKVKKIEIVTGATRLNGIGAAVCEGACSKE